MIAGLSFKADLHLCSSTDSSKGLYVGMCSDDLLGCARLPGTDTPDGSLRSEADTLSKENGLL